MGGAPRQKREWPPLSPQAGGSPSSPGAWAEAGGGDPVPSLGQRLCRVGAEGFRERMLLHEPSWGWGSPGRDERCWGRC